jgi:flavin reductase (DIM6/NTAB) family NADH-FMN oxidoreductase RutF
MTGPSCYIETVVGADDFRHVCGHFATGVTIITTRESDGRPTGLTASAFTSVSLDPPLVLVCVSHKSQSFPALRDGGTFAVNILRDSEEAVSRRFATTRLDKFDGVPYTVSPLGLPLLDDALAHVECVTVSAYPEGDHTIFVGRVERARAESGDPLLYFRGQYQRLAPTCRGA